MISASGNTSGLPELMLVDGQSGQLIAEPYIPASSYTDQHGDIQNGYSPIGSPIVSSDGTAYVEYEVRQIAYPPVVTSAVLYLLQIAPDNSITPIQLSSTSSNENLFPERVIPDGQGGVLATWVIEPGAGPLPANPYQAAHIVSGTVTAAYSLPFTPQNFVVGPDGLPVNPSLVLGESGVVLATDGTSSGDSTNPSLGPKVVSFDLGSGAVNWTYQVGIQSTLSILTALSGNAVDINDSQAGLSQLDSGGNQSQLSGVVNGLAQASWSGNWHVQTSQGQSELAMPDQTLADSFWAMPGGNESGNGAAIEQAQTNQTQGMTHQLPPSGATLNSNYNSIELLTSQSPAFIFSTYLQTFWGAQPQSNNEVAQVPQNTTVTASGQIVSFTLLGLPGRMLQLASGKGSFNVQVERFDTAADTISVVTLQGHPLAGWRYWRAYSIGTNDVVNETGAVDTNAPGLLNWAGYWMFRFAGIQIKMWREYVRYIQSQIGAAQGSNPAYNFVNGEWNPTSPSQSDILYNVCQASSCN